MSSSMMTSLEELEAIIEQRYQAALDKARMERDADIAALRRVSALYQSVEGNGLFHVSPIADEQPHSCTVESISRRLDDEIQETRLQYGAMATEIRRAVRELPGEFTVRDVIDFVREKSGLEVNATTVSSALTRLIGKDELVCLVQGSGKRPGVFKRTALVGDGEQRHASETEGIQEN